MKATLLHRREDRVLVRFHLVFGSVPEWLMGADCKSAGSAYVGSNPTRPIHTCPCSSAVEHSLGKGEVSSSSLDKGFPTTPRHRVLTPADCKQAWLEILASTGIRDLQPRLLEIPGVAHCGDQNSNLTLQEGPSASSRIPGSSPTATNPNHGPCREPMPWSLGCGQHWTLRPPCREPSKSRTRNRGALVTTRRCNSL